MSNKLSIASLASLFLIVACGTGAVDNASAPVGSPSDADVAVPGTVSPPVVDPNTPSVGAGGSGSSASSSTGANPGAASSTSGGGTSGGGSGSGPGSITTGGTAPTTPSSPGNPNSIYIPIAPGVGITVPLPGGKSASYCWDEDLDPHGECSDSFQCDGLRICEGKKCTGEARPKGDTSCDSQQLSKH